MQRLAPIGPSSVQKSAAKVRKRELHPLIQSQGVIKKMKSQNILWKPLVNPNKKIKKKTNLKKYLIHSTELNSKSSHLKRRVDPMRFIWSQLTTTAQCLLPKWP